MIRHAACGYGHRTSRSVPKNNQALDSKNSRGWNYNNWIWNYFRPTGYLDELVPETPNNNEGMQILTIPALDKTVTNITAAELSSGRITRTLRLFRKAWPNTKGANGGMGNQDIYEFFVGLLY